MDVRDKIYINGGWVPSTGTGTLEVLFEAEDTSGDVLTVQGTLTN